MTNQFPNPSFNEKIGVELRIGAQLRCLKNSTLIKVIFYNF